MANEKRLIDLSTLGIGERNPNAFNDPERAYGWNDLLKILETAPTIDAVEVVRCRDCKYWGDQDGKLQNSDGEMFARCKAHNYLIDGRHTGWCPSENDFCSYGDRKDGDGNG